MGRPWWESKKFGAVIAVIVVVLLKRFVDISDQDTMLLSGVVTAFIVGEAAIDYKKKPTDQK